jgi:hypothetical protein
MSTTNHRELTDTKGLRYKRQFTFRAYFNTKLSELHHRTTLFTFLTTLFGLTPLGIYNCDTGKARVLALGLLLSLLRWHLSDVIIGFNVNINGSPSWVTSQLFQLQQLIGNVQFISKLNLSLLQVGSSPALLLLVDVVQIQSSTRLFLFLTNDDVRLPSQAEDRQTLVSWFLSDR